MKPTDAIGKDGKEIVEADVLDHVWGYGVSIDLTRFDIQDKAKEMGRPLGHGQGGQPSGSLHGAVPGFGNRPPLGTCHLAQG